MSVGTIIFILIAVISGVSSLLDNDKKKAAPGKKGGASKGVLSEFQKQLQQIEATVNQGINDETSKTASNARGQMKPKKVVQHQRNVKEDVKQKVKEQAVPARQKKAATHNFTLAEQIYKIENDQNLTSRQKQNRIQSLVMAQDIEVASDDLTFDKAAVLNGIIMSEVLGKPKSLQ
ncbi:hypothetical protein [Macrococcoides canis]|uniref:hypothetical protein n=1 Tax=Macrococcoides canis TaxID=1855823 RepID=UPI0020B8DA6E|nr:hypothetical protein [Macrococcus canis]UTG99220.1 hypothetical protein KFV04_06805 [Macrococcus canis]WBF53716.1 hypothetical protein LL975_05325 [Macrococcus canis]